MSLDRAISPTRNETDISLSDQSQTNRYLGGILTMSEKKRQTLEEEGELENLVGHRPAKSTTTIGVAMLLSLIVIAYVLFIMFSL